ncbi:putative L-amino acid N-acyltransferase YncA [Paratrimastix pyriformis]|uniref:L-amino acid N-acyltransferase YncA n=1 Tax=Paratrimastix pyriformis TaxID=342808 RepID=A0ABQ8UUH9_9EUKA|nr:putative L-amino acid N-acyltransferase YncA [Paratrimastix pyriformis]
MQSIGSEELSRLAHQGTAHPAVHWRVATPDDVPDLLNLIKELALYEHEPDAVKTSEEDLRVALFSSSPNVFCHVVDHPDPASGKRLAGLALYFMTFSTWVGKHGIHLEDLFVRPEVRGRGIGLTLLRSLAQVCVERGYGRLEWACLDWNRPSIAFYKAQGAVPMDEWTTYRLAAEALTNFAQGKHAAGAPHQ